MTIVKKEGFGETNESKQKEKELTRLQQTFRFFCLQDTKNWQQETMSPQLYRLRTRKTDPTGTNKNDSDDRPRVPLSETATIDSSWFSFVGFVDIDPTLSHRLDKI